MSSIQDLIGKIENNKKTSEKIKEKSRGKSSGKSIPKKPVQKKSSEEIATARKKFSGKKAENSVAKTFIKKGINKKSEKKIKPGFSQKQKNKPASSKKQSNKNSAIKKRFFVTQVCTSKKSCGEKFGPYIWERLCNDYNQEPECDSFEVQGFRFERSPCQGACKKSANIRMKEDKAERHTQFSYLTPIKASKLIKMIKSGASPENIKRI